MKVLSRVLIAVEPGFRRGRGYIKGYGGGDFLWRKRSNDTQISARNLYRWALGRGANRFDQR